MDDWLELLKQGAYDSVFYETEQYLNSWRQVTRLEAKLLREFQHNFVQILYHLLQLKELQAGIILEEPMAPERVAAAVRSLTDLQDWVKEMLHSAVAACQAAERSESAIDKAIRYIRQHLSHNPTREDIAKFVHLHPDYLSRVFKKETGKSIVDFIQEEKMQIAKELLLKTDLSVSGIAIKVGFSNFSYFAKLFKQATRMNPQEFRETHKWIRG